MSMERHRCKLCSKVFSNGRALGGHMRSHLATLPLPPKRKTEQKTEQQAQLTESDSSSTQSASYGLRENPKRSLRASDPEFLDAGSVVDERESQERESDTESTPRPVRKRSRRGRAAESPAESNPVSSVSDPSRDEEVALCLMMLSRDVWVRGGAKEEREVSQRRKLKCLGCSKVFKTNRALAGHKASNKACQGNDEIKINGGSGNNNNDCLGEEQRIYECPFCCKVFGSGQALGGHKRSHLLGSSSISSSTTTKNNVVAVVVVASNDDDGDDDVDDDENVVGGDFEKVGDTTSFVLDLNLPAPVEDYEES